MRLQRLEILIYTMNNNNSLISQCLFNPSLCFLCTHAVIAVMLWAVLPLQHRRHRTSVSTCETCLCTESPFPLLLLPQQSAECTFQRGRYLHWTFLPLSYQYIELTAQNNITYFLHSESC